MKEALWLTVFLVEHNFHLKLRLRFKRLLNSKFVFFLRLWAVEEFAGASLLHDLGTSVASELAEAIAAVHDGVKGGDLCVTQHEVTVCGGRERET